MSSISVALAVSVLLGHCKASGLIELRAFAPFAPFAAMVKWKKSAASSPNINCLPSSNCSPTIRTRQKPPSTKISPAMFEMIMPGASSSRTGFGHAGLYRRTLKEFPAGGPPTHPAAAANPPSGKAKGRSTHAFSSCLAHVHITCEVVLDENGKEANKELPRHVGKIRFWLTKDDIALVGRGPREEILSIDSNLTAEENIHKFLTGIMNNGNDDIGVATFHDVPNTATSDCFKLGITSPPSCRRDGHEKLIFMDGTFAIRLQKMLLFMVLVINEKYKGVPVALFLFSASPKNRATSSDYGAAILLRFLLKWKAAMEGKGWGGFYAEGETKRQLT
ncbi:hypothetical protein BDK51DRAFT_46036 [Blyttiomyces helicus]|uniref:Uncharacterized protein n=1 Tax=Blyttiomyces helicus TaxID=388810 RepID=A0A4P9WEH0_9FUNG|nr:hypothetical protein BDK51DRAFT_46036 [Blyttiomyces helicus]|eukprot:RKO91119.1 hypothetical protein BDK51DRAFT_46036 [Blyttiomyces helicus]